MINEPENSVEPPAQGLSELVVDFLMRRWDIMVEDHKAVQRTQISSLTQAGDAWIRAFALEHSLVLGTLGCLMVLLDDALAEIAFERMDAEGIITLTP